MHSAEHGGADNMSQPRTRRFHKMMPQVGCVLVDAVRMHKHTSHKLYTHMCVTHGCMNVCVCVCMYVCNVAC